MTKEKTDMAAPELLPCPFCGGHVEADWHYNDNSDGGGRGKVICSGCQAEMVSDDPGWMNNQADRDRCVSESIAAWNLRADLSAPSALDDWREIEQGYQPRLSEGYTAVRVSKPGFWLVKGDGPATAQAATSAPADVEGLVERLRVKGRMDREQANHHIRRMEVERIEAATALTEMQARAEKVEAERDAWKANAEALSDSIYAVYPDERAESALAAYAKLKGEV